MNTNSVKTLLTTAFTCILFLCQGQTEVFISKKPSEVPAGKKWIVNLKSNIVFNLDSSLNGNSNSCLTIQNFAPSNSEPDLKANLGYLVKGHYRQPESVFSFFYATVDTLDLEEFPNNKLPSTIFERNLENPINYYKYPGLKEITFYEGEVVYTSGCLGKISAFEFPLGKVFNENQSDRANESKTNQLFLQPGDVIKTKNDNGYELSVAQKAIIHLAQHLEWMKVNEAGAYSYRIKTFEEEKEQFGKVQHASMFVFYADFAPKGKLKDVSFNLQDPITGEIVRGPISDSLLALLQNEIGLKILSGTQGEKQELTSKIELGFTQEDSLNSISFDFKFNTRKGIKGLASDLNLSTGISPETLENEIRSTLDQLNLNESGHYSAQVSYSNYYYTIKPLNYFRHVEFVTKSGPPSILSIDINPK